MKARFLVIAALSVSMALAGCECRKRGSDFPLYVLEELEAASSVENPKERIERLRIFLDNHISHPYRSLAVARLGEACFEAHEDPSRAVQELHSHLVRETDPAARAQLILAHFEYLLEHDRASALTLADTIGRSERFAHLFMMIGYYLMDSKQDADAAVAAFSRAAELARGTPAAAQAMAMSGQVLIKSGRTEEALAWLEASSAAGNPQADRMLGDINWSENRRSEAIERYISCVASMPGARSEIDLDSLYNLLYPADSKLEERIRSKRIVDGGPFPALVFTDIEGKRYDIERLRGTKLVFYALSPT